MLLYLLGGDLRAVLAAVFLHGFSAPSGRRCAPSPVAALHTASPETGCAPAASSPAPAAPPPKADGDCKKPSICTADELHYAPVAGTEWRLALWRYRPAPQAPKRNHPLMLLSGVATNAIGFDLSPGASFARHMSMQGFDTWIVEVRGAGLSVRGSEIAATNHQPSKPAKSDLDESYMSKLNSAVPVNDQSTDQNSNISIIIDKNEFEKITWDETQLVTKLADALTQLGETFSGYLKDSQLRSISGKFFDRLSRLLEDAALTQRLNEVAEKISGLLEAPQNSAISSQIRDLSQRLVKILEEGQQTVTPRLSNLQERFSATIEDLQKQLELIISYDWDFDHYLEEDIPAAMDYIRSQSRTKDGKLLAIGHSMGGILLYAMVSKCEFEGVKPGLAAIVTLASSVDYTTSNSSLKMLLPLADPAQVLHVPAVPLGALLAAAYPLSSRTPYILSWLSSQITAHDMMHPELLSKLILNSFCTVPAKVLLQLTTAFHEGGLRNRTGTFTFKDHLHKCNVPVLALAADEDQICPPEAVYETVKHIPQHMVIYKVFGKPDGPHYAHYDLVGGRLAIDEVYPCILDFLSRHDDASS